MATDGGRRDRKRQQTLNHIASVAARLFARDGYAPVTMEQIAQAADVAKGTLYNHFPTKEAVLAHSIHYELGNNLQMLTKRLTPEMEFSEGIGMLLDAQAKWSEAHREYLAPYLRFRFMDIQAPTPHTGSSGPNDIVDVYASLIGNSQRSGQIRPDIDAAHLAVLLHHLCLGAVLRWLLNDELKLRKELAAAVDVFTNGTAPTSVAPKSRRKRT